MLWELYWLRLNFQCSRKQILKYLFSCIIRIIPTILHQIPINLNHAIKGQEIKNKQLIKMAGLENWADKF